MCESRYIMWQSLKALKFMHSAELLHRDMKPSNLLLNSDCLMKVADFGLARSLRDSDIQGGTTQTLTDYVATRWYRAPEILLGSNRYTFGVDMWSMGCILAEMISGKPIFPGASTINQLEKIIELTGYPTDDEKESVNSPFAATLLESIPKDRPTVSDWRDRFPNASDDAIDLLQKLLQFDPSKRLSAEEALSHAYVNQFHDPGVERKADFKVQVVIDDNEKKSTAVYRERLYHEITKMKRSSSAAR